MKANRFKRAGRRLNGQRIKLFGKVKSIAFLICILAIAIAVYLYFYSYPANYLFPVKQIMFAGNRHITDDELRSLSGIRQNESLLLISGRKVSRQLLKSPWVRSVSVRKEFPDTISMMIQEAEPFALLDMNGHLYLMDEKGKLLEEMRDNSVPFLPVIEGDPYKEKEGLSEALHLAKLMNDRGFSSEKDHIEIIAHKPYELSVKLDGTVVKIGAGRYEEKLEKLVHLEEDIKDMNVQVEYIDLRFENKAIVKPVTDMVMK